MFNDLNRKKITSATLTIITVFVLYSCGQPGKPTAVTQMQDNATIDSASITNKSNQIQPLPSPKSEFELPEGVYLDSLISYDSSRALSIEIILPKSKENQLASENKILTKVINNDKSKFIKELDELLKEDKSLRQSATGSEFSVNPEQLYKDQSVLSYLLTKEVYWAGAVHPKTDYYTFNYDIKKQREITFSDFFSFNTKADSTNLLNLINNALGNNQYVMTKKFYAFDFSFDNQSVSFNFDEYEVASYADGLQRAKIDRKELSKYINSEYR